MTKDEAELLERMLEAFSNDLKETVGEMRTSLEEQGKSVVRMEEQLKGVNVLRNDVNANSKHILEVAIGLVVGLLSIVAALLMGG